MSVVQASLSSPSALTPRRSAAWVRRAAASSLDFARTGTAERVCRGLLGLGMLAYVVLFLRLTFLLLDRQGVRTYDLAIFDQATWLISRGQAPFVTVRGLPLLAEHFSAVLYLLAPLYRLWDSPKTLLLVQTLALSLGALPVYALARKKLHSAPLALLLSLAYLLYPPLQWSNTFEFHPDTLVTPCLLAAFYFLTEKRWRPVFLLLGLAALCKETVGLEIIALGVYAALLHRRSVPDRNQGLLLTAFGAACLLVAFATVSHLNEGRPSLFFLLYSRYGHSPGQIALFAAGHPLRVASDLAQADNRLYAFQLLYPVLFLSLLAPEVLLLALPALGLHLLSEHGIMHTIYFQYSALITPFVFASAILGAARCRAWGNRRTGLLLGVALIFGMVQGASQRPASSPWPTLPPTFSAAPSGETARLLSLIPPQASLTTQVALMPRLCHRREVYMFPNPFQRAAWGNGPEAMRQMGADGYSAPDVGQLKHAVAGASVEYVALCPPTTAFPLAPHDPLYLAFLVPLVQSPSYGIVAIGQDTVILRRGADHASGLRLLAQRTGQVMPVVPNDQAVEKSVRAWIAAQPVRL